MYPFKDTLIGANKVAENVAKLFGNNASLLTKAGASALIGTVVSSAINIANGQDWTEAILESGLKTIPVSVIFTIMTVQFGLPVYVASGASFIFSFVIDELYKDDFLDLKSTVENISDTINQISIQDLDLNYHADK